MKMKAARVIRLSKNKKNTEETTGKMGRQYNKAQKRARRKGYLQRVKARAREEIKRAGKRR